MPCCVTLVCSGRSSKAGVGGGFSLVYRRTEKAVGEASTTAPLAGAAMMPQSSPGTSDQDIVVVAAPVSVDSPSRTLALLPEALAFWKRSSWEACAVSVLGVSGSRWPTTSTTSSSLALETLTVGVVLLLALVLAVQNVVV